MTDLLNPFLTKGLTSSAFKSEVLGQLPPTKISPNPKTSCNPNPRLNPNRVGERGAVYLGVNYPDTPFTDFL